MKNLEILKALNGIGGVINQQERLLKENPAAKRFPAKITFAINSNKHILYEKYKPYEETLKTLDKNSETYKEEVEELLNSEVDLDIKKVCESDFKDYDPTFAELDALSFMLEEK